MVRARLILIEGLPGSGKTTTAEFVADWLRRHGVDVALFLEGDLDHPADYEYVARLDDKEFAALKWQFPDEAAILENHVVVDGDDRLLRYRRLQQTYPQLSGALVDTLARSDIYELPVPLFRRVLLRSWRQFAARSISQETTFVFECCFLQNPLTMYFGRHDEPEDALRAFILELAETVRPLSPQWIYLHTADVDASLRDVSRARPQAWLDSVISYHTRQGRGRTGGWQGFEGLVKFYEMRQTIELALLPQLLFSGLCVTHAGWEQDRDKIREFLAQVFTSSKRA